MVDSDAVGSTMGWVGSSIAANFAPGQTQPLVEILRSDHGACPVCRHASGDCVGDSPGLESSINFVRKVDDPSATFSVPERVYESFLQGTRKVRRLLHAPGDRITPKEARRLGLMPPLAGEDS